jgi:hypothetical protein
MRKANKYAHLADGTVLVVLERRDKTLLPCCIDGVDWPHVRGYRWHAQKNFNTFYVRTNVRTPNGKQATLRMHNLLLPDAKIVDHEDGSGLNNQRTNLRPATHAENIRNSRKDSDAITSKYRGVYRQKGKKFRAQIMFNDTRKHLGMFVNEKDAARAYDAAALKYCGEFARLNFPQPAQLKVAA